MSKPPWLKRYYGNECAEFDPEVIFEGKRLAVVKIARAGVKGSSGLGFVLVRKSGSHQAGPEKSLYEGVPSETKVAEMKKVLEQED